MKISIIGTVGLPASYGGFETLAQNLVDDLGAHFDFEVFCSSVDNKNKNDYYKQAKLTYIPLSANGAQSIIYDVISTFIALRNVDILLVLGVSGCLCLPIVKLISNKRIITNIDGLEWRRDKWGKIAKRFLKWSEKLAVMHSDIVIADNKAIRDYVHSEYNKNCELIAYGGDHVVLENKSFKQNDLIPFATTKTYAIKICRIEPENNVHVVLEAFRTAATMSLIIVGNWSNSEYGRSLKQRYIDCGNIHLNDPIYDLDILYQLRSNAAFYVHGHSAGGTNPSLVEAMTMGLPVVAFDVKYNRETTQNKAIFFKSEGELVSILEKSTTIDWGLVAETMLSIASKEYTWVKVSGSYAKLFESVNEIMM